MNEFAEVRVSLKAISLATGYSKNTVSLALRHDPRVRPGTGVAIRQAAEKMGYRCDPVVSRVMSEMRRGSAPGFQGKLALINLSRDARAWMNDSDLAAWVGGADRCAGTLGYSFDRFWSGEGHHRAAHWSRVFQTRRIRGVVIVGLEAGACLPQHLASLWHEWPTVLGGLPRLRCPVSYVSVDYHQVMMTALSQVRAYGYERPGLALGPVGEGPAGSRYTAGFYAGQADGSTPIPIFNWSESDHTSRARFGLWYDRHGPDVVLTTDAMVQAWLESRDIRCPRDAGLLHLNWCSAHSNWAGINQLAARRGEVAIDLLVRRIREHARGNPGRPTGTEISAAWVSGSTLPPKRAQSDFIDHLPSFRPDGCLVSMLP